MSKNKKRNKHSPATQRETRLARNLVEAAYEFHRHRLWNHFDADQCFGLRVPTEEDLVVACVMGQGGEEYGLCLYRGPDAVRNVCATLTGSSPDEVRLDVLGMTVQPLWEVDPDLRGILDRAGVQARRETSVPTFICKRPGLQPRTPNTTEIKTLLYAMCGTITAFSRGELRPSSPLAHRKIQVLSMSGEPAAPSVEDTREAIEAAARRSAPISVASIPAGLPRLPTTWAVGWSVCPARIEGDDREVNLVLVLDTSRDLIIAAEVMLGADVAEASDKVVGAFCGDNSVGVRGLPAKIIVRGRNKISE